MTEIEEYNKKECKVCGGDRIVCVYDRYSSNGIKEIPCEACHNEDDDIYYEDNI